MENRYDKYKDSGIAWIGEIPEHWDKNKIIRLFSIIGSGTTPKSSKEDNYIGSVNWIQSGDINGGYIENCKNTISDTALKEYSTLKIYKAPFIIVAMYGASVGNISISNIDGCVNQACCVMNETKQNFKYLFYAMNSVKRYLIYKAEGGGQPNISQDKIKNTWMPIPPFEEQQSIATYLDQKCSEIDELITLQEEMITKLQSYKQSVITEAVTKGLDKNVPLKDSGIEWIGEIPEHWEVKRLKNVCSTNNASLSDKTSKEFEFDYVDIGSVSFELGIHKTERYTFQNAPSRARKIARLGDIIVSTVRTYLRAIDIINSEEKEKYIYSTGFAILSPLKNILSEFMIYICRSEYFTNLVSIYSTGINYPSINDTALKMINIVIPPIHEQQSIADYLDQKCSEIDELISIKQQKIEKLKDYKKSLIFECVTGKRKVS